MAIQGADAAREMLIEQLTMMRDAVARVRGESGRCYPYSSIHDFVLRHGLASPWQPAPAGTIMDRPRECYANAGRHALRDDNVLYCEGYGLRLHLGIIVAHAWVADARTGAVLDTTWKVQPDEERAYFGVPFATDYLAAVIARAHSWGLLDRWEAGFPLLTGQDSIATARSSALDGLGLWRAAAAPREG